jgi:protein-S-isoprenylcysteine O-methyltransferase Ste14
MVLLGYMVFMAYVMAIVIAQFEIRRHFRPPPLHKQLPDHGRVIVLALSQMAMMAALMLYGRGEGPVSWRWFAPTVFNLVGAGLLIGGLALSLWAHWSLGRNWFGGIGMFNEHELVTTGPYRFVRHPMYLGMFISAFGMGLISKNWLFGVGAVLFAVAFAQRVPGEEKLLREHRKTSRRYADYATRTGGFVPWFTRSARPKKAGGR